MTRRALVKRLEREAMRVHRRWKAHGYYQSAKTYDAVAALSIACVALAAHDRRKKNG